MTYSKQQPPPSLESIRDLSFGDLKQLVTITLPTQMDVKEDRPVIAPNTPVILEPKLDGCQIILIPLKNGTLPVTRKGQVVTRLIDEVQSYNLKHVAFTEYEPTPWSEENKHKLTANLYNTKPILFATALTAFNATTLDVFLAGQVTKQDITVGRGYMEQLPIPIVPAYAMSYEDAMRECSQHINTPTGTRVNIKGTLCEGGVIYIKDKCYKQKPTQDIDVLVFDAVTSPKGQRGWVALDTKVPHTPYLIYGGVTPTNHQSMVGRVVEVSQLLVTAIDGAGNPTFQRDRSNEKDATREEVLRGYSAAHGVSFDIKAFTSRYGVNTISKGQTVC